MSKLNKNQIATLESNNAFVASIELIKAAIVASAAVVANDTISADKARLTMLNRLHRCKRFSKIAALNNDAITIINNNTTPNKIESTAIYAVDKVIQIARYLSGDVAVYGRGKNNSTMYLLQSIALNSPAYVTRDFVVNSLTRYGQPHESADTQASSSCKALLALGCLDMIKAGTYTVNTDSKLMNLLLSQYTA
jgi:hypothetical protein